MLRTSTEMIFYNGVNSTNMRLLDLLNTSNQLSTGKRILTPADDPIASARVLETSQSKAVVKQFGDNIGYANDGMALLETKLKGIEDIVQYVRRQTVYAGDGSLTPKDISYIEQDLRQQFEAILSLANTQDAHGDYIFSGYRTNDKPYDGTLGKITYHGDQGERTIQVSNTRFMPITMPGTSIFDRSRNIDVNAVRTPSEDKPTTNDALYSYRGAHNQGDSTALTVSFNTTPPANPGDPAAVDPNTDLGKRYILTYTQPDPDTYGTWGVEELDSDGNRQTVTAAYTAPAPGTPGTLTFNGITVEVPDDPPPVDPTDNTPLVDGDKFEVYVASNSMFDNYALFMSSLTEHSEVSVAGGVSFALENFDYALENILTLHTQMGAQMNETQRLDDLGADLKLQYEKVISRFEDVDYTEAISNLMKERTYLQAAQLTFTKISNLNLFNYLS